VNAAQDYTATKENAGHIVKLILSVTLGIVVHMKVLQILVIPDLMNPRIGV